MGIGDIVKQVKQKVKEEELVKLVDVLDLFDEKFHNEFEYFINKTGADREDIYFLAGGSPPFFYYKPPYYVNFYSFETAEDEESIGWEPISIYKKKKEFIDKALETNNFASYLMLIEGPVDLLLFTNLFSSLKGSYKYELLTDLYTEVDYGHSIITKEMWREALKTRTTDNKSGIYGHKEELVIYRGSASESTPVNEAMSWTLSFNTAIFFASRYDTDVVSIYKAKVKRSDVIDYFGGRNEAEVVCFPEDIYSIEEVKQYSVDTIMQNLKENRIIDEYGLYKNTFLTEDTNLKAHDKIHSQRVLLLSLTLSELLHLSHSDRAILANVAIYHDSGRINDNEDNLHGKRSLELYESNDSTAFSVRCKGVSFIENYKLDPLMKEDLSIFKWIVEYHCLPDEVGLKALKFTQIKNKERARKLYKTFKDADSLDRVRFSGLDVNYLRTPESKKLIIYALQLYRNIR